MKKIFYCLFALIIVSCSSSDDIILENQQIPEGLEPDKALVFYMEFPKMVLLTPSYYTFSYENGKLVKMNGRLMDNGMFFPESFRTLSYNDNHVTLKESNSPQKIVSYTIENGRPKKSEVYINGVLLTSKTYTYEVNKLTVYEETYNKNFEVYRTYFFDSNKNLIKSEKLEKTMGVDQRLTKTNYSNFDSAKNPFKKLSLVDDVYFEKSLSANNYRKIGGTTTEFDNPNNAPDGTFEAEWFYKYNSEGEVLLYYPL